MLTELAIKNLGVIDEAVLNPAPGMTALTGETGAGKTMIVSGLGLISGGKADTALVRRGADRARVEARFSPVSATLANRITDLGGELDSDELIIARHLTQGRSRGWLGGAQAPQAVIADVSSDLVTIHGQSEQIRLGSADRQREVLDRAAGAGIVAPLERYRANWAKRREALVQLTQLRQDSQDRARQIDLLQYGLAEIEKVDPQPGEDAELAAEQTKLQAADDLRVRVAASITALTGDDQGDFPGAAGTVSTASKTLESAVADDEGLRDYVTRLNECSYVLADISQDLSSYLVDLEADPLRLEAIAQRRSDLQHLTRKYGATINDVLEWARSSAMDLSVLTASDERIAGLEAEISALTLALQTDATTITAQRRAAADRLTQAVLAELKALAMPHARLEFQLQELAELGPHGAESVTLLFSANPGSQPGPLAKVASGGELSRVRLGLEVVLASSDDPQTFVFDEVDAGVGGATALEIGRRLAKLGKRSQVLVVTHLAQVAAFADAHFVVQKSNDGQVTTSGIVQVEGAEREAELARMMGGLEDAASARAHARDLLQEAAR